MVAVNPAPSPSDGPLSLGAAASDGAAPPEAESAGEAFATHLANAAAAPPDEILDGSPPPDGEEDATENGLPTPPAPSSPTTFGAPPSPPATPPDQGQYTTEVGVDPALSNPQALQLRESLGITEGIARVIRMAREHVPEGAVLHIFNTNPAEFVARFQVDPNVPVTPPTLTGAVKTVPGTAGFVDGPIPPPPPPPPSLDGFDLGDLAIPAPPSIPVDEIVLDDGEDESLEGTVPDDGPPLPLGVSSAAPDPGTSQSRAAAVYRQSMSRLAGGTDPGPPPIIGLDDRTRDAR